MPVCGPIGRECFEDLLDNGPYCRNLPIPCQGFYADMNLFHHEGRSVLDLEDMERWPFTLQYTKHTGRLADMEVKKKIPPELKGDS